MAVRLRQNHRTEVRPGFWVALSVLGFDHVRKITEEMRKMDPQQRARWAKRYAARFITISKIRKRDESILTSLIHANWTYLDGIEAHGDRWLVMHLDNVLIQPVAKKIGPSFDMGGYTVYIPGQSLIGDALGLIHFVPERALLTLARHPHHYVYENEYDDPKLAIPSTCWGGYEGWIRTAMSRWEIPDLLYALKQFVTHYTPGDTLRPLTRKNFPWAKEIQ